MADLLANLPPVPPSLKSITPYLQRAEELRTQDPVIAYWCAYYAAQVGINSKTRDAGSRDLLLALLGALEQTKNEIGPNDAIHIESASSAYVENFALKVFANADNEDRSVHATRSTAKKFLAAANFLEVLKTFPKSDVSESNEEKIRYAKWKAADIAKAFREGRKPAPGPPGWAEEQNELKRLQQELQQEQQQIPSAPTLPPSDSEFPLASDPTVTTATLFSYEASQDKSSSPSSNIDSSHPPTSSLPPLNDLLRPYPGRAERGDHPSETRSTITIPGVSESPNLIPAIMNGTNLGWKEIPSSNWLDNTTESDNGEAKTRSERGSNPGTIDLSAEETFQGTACVSQEVEGQYGPSSSINALAEPDYKLQFSPSTPGPRPPQPPPQPHFGSATEYHGSLNVDLPPRSTVFSSSPPSSSDPHIYNAFTHRPPPVVYSPSRAPPPPTVSVQEDCVELTPGIIAKTRKHCRFAISALDYDDAEQAKKELRTALALLGG